MPSKNQFFNTTKIINLLWHRTRCIWCPNVYAEPKAQRILIQPTTNLEVQWLYIDYDFQLKLFRVPPWWRLCSINSYSESGVYFMLKLFWVPPWWRLCCLNSYSESGVYFLLKFRWRKLLGIYRWEMCTCWFVFIFWYLWRLFSETSSPWKIFC